MESRPRLHILFSRQEIEAAVRRLAGEISRDYGDKFPLLIGILKGSFVFMADLIRHLDFSVEVDFIGAASYGCATSSSGQVKLLRKLQSEVKGREVLLVEDIVDTGLTTACLLENLRRKKPASLRLCALTDKPARRKVPIAIDYLGFTVPDRFLVGYGLDLDQKFRNLPDICYLEEG
jgi:hypoxanthine phosphoribosyltransferase